MLGINTLEAEGGLEGFPFTTGAKLRETSIPFAGKLLLLERCVKDRHNNQQKLHSLSEPSGGISSTPPKLVQFS